jgi:hypothetical protein
MEPMGHPSRFASEIRERAIRIVEEQAREQASEWAAIRSVAEKLGCRDDTLRRWVRHAEP